MGLFEGFEAVRLVRVRPGLRERLEQRIAASHHTALVIRLKPQPRPTEGRER